MIPIEYLAVILIIVATLLYIYLLLLIVPAYLGTKVIDQDFFEWTPDEELEDALLKFVENRNIVYYDKGRKETALPAGLKYLYDIYLFEKDVCEKGISRHFYNTSGQSAREARYGYLFFGCEKMADLLQEAMDIYDSEKHQYMRAKKTGAHNDFMTLNEHSLLESLNERFDVLVRELRAQRAQLIRENMEYFFCKR